MMVLKDIESHFGKDIIKLGAEVILYFFSFSLNSIMCQDVDEIEKLNQ